MKLTKEQMTIPHLNVIAQMTEDMAKKVSLGVRDFPDVLGESDAMPDIDWVAKLVYDTDVLSTAERQAVLSHIMKLDILAIWKILTHRATDEVVVRTIRSSMYNTAVYHLPDFTSIHWDSYAMRLGALHYTHMCRLSLVLERDREKQYGYEDALQIVNHPVDNYSYVKEFVRTYMGIPDATEADVLRTLYAFRKLHVYEAWLVSRSAILGIPIPDAGMDHNQVVNKVSRSVQILREAAGYAPPKETLVMDLAGMVSDRLYAHIKKAETLEELIEYPSATVRFRSQSPALAEELLNLYRSHGYPDAYIGWLTGVGPRIFVNVGGAKNA